MTREEDRTEQEIEMYGRQSDMRGQASFGGGSGYGPRKRVEPPVAVRMLRPSIYEQSALERRISGRVSDQVIRNTIQSILGYVDWSENGVRGEAIVSALRGRTVEKGIDESFAISVREQWIETGNAQKNPLWTLTPQGRLALNYLQGADR